MITAQTVDELIASFDAAFEQGEGGLPRAVLTHGESSAHVYMLGAHVSHFQPPGHEPVLWMSAHSDFLPGSPICCGVPVCVPWFAMREDRPDLPNHGFARTRPWRVVDAGRASVMLELTGDDETRAMWPHEFVFRMHVELDDALTMALTVQNTGNEPVTVTEALHSYFHVADVRRVSVTGLEGVPYYSKVEGGTHCSDQPITIDAETDRVYARTAATRENFVDVNEVLFHRFAAMMEIGHACNPYDPVAEGSVGSDGLAADFLRGCGMEGYVEWQGACMEVSRKGPHIHYCVRWAGPRDPMDVPRIC